MAEPTVLAALRRAVGPDRVLDAEADKAPYLTDERKRFWGAAVAVVQPRTPEEVAAVAVACSAAGTPMVPQGGNTGLCGGATAPTSGAAVVVSLERLNRVRRLDVENFTITVDAGLTVGAVAAEAAAAGRAFPLSFGADGSAQIGGALSTNAGGTAVLRHGSARDLALGVEAVLADGRVFSDLAGLRKDNTGYSLSDLFIGAEGTLGIITGATLRLVPSPAERVTVLIAVRSVEQAVELLGRFRAATDDRLDAFEWMGTGALTQGKRPRALKDAPGDLLLLEASSAVSGDALSRSVVHEIQAVLASDAAVDAAVASGSTMRAEFWALRESIPEAENRQGGSLKHDLSVRVSAVPELLRRATEAVLGEAPDVTISAFGHLGDGNIHFNVIGCRDSGEERVTEAIFDVVEALDGSFSAEHGVGRLRREELVRRKSAVHLDLMRTLKKGLDPAGLMNPGAVL